ncbi:zinc ribbon domain-containing protein [Bacillaceae bacterium S4-13-56]
MQNRGGNKGRKLKPHTRQEFFDVFHCSECRSPVIHVRSSGDGSHYWRCKASEKKNGILSCKVRGFREESIEHTFIPTFDLNSWKARHNGISTFNLVTTTFFRQSRVSFSVDL